MADVSFSKAVAQADELIQKGGKVYQKFTCAKCGTRQTMDTPDIFYKSGKCEECGHITNIEEQGCGFLLHIPLGGVDA